MALEISGKLVSLLPEQTGTGKNGAWVKQDFVIETTEQYPKKVCFSAWADKAQMVKNLQMGQTVKVFFNAESREFNGKWYTDLRIWKIETNESGDNTPTPFPDYQVNDGNTLSNTTEMGASDLPF
jgi:hypothetical protein